MASTSSTGFADLFMDFTSDELSTFLSTSDVECIWRMMKHFEILKQWAQTDTMSRDFILSTLATLLDNPTNRDRIPVWPRTLLYHTKTIALAARHPSANLPDQIQTLDTTLALAREVKKASDEGDEEKLKAQGASGQYGPRPGQLDDMIKEGEKLVAHFREGLGMTEEERNAPHRP